MTHNDELCTSATPHWECNEVILAIHGQQVVLHEDLIDDGRWKHGYVNYASVSLTLDEAKALCDSLNAAIASYEKSERDCQEYFRLQREKEGGDSSVLNIYSAPPNK